MFAKVFLIILIHGLYLSCSQEELKQYGEEWSFVVFGDLRQGYGIYSKLATLIGMIEPIPTFTVCCGDIMTQPGNEVEWLNFWRYLHFCK